MRTRTALRRRRLRRPVAAIGSDGGGRGGFPLHLSPRFGGGRRLSSRRKAVHAAEWRQSSAAEWRQSSAAEWQQSSAAESSSVVCRIDVRGEDGLAGLAGFQMQTFGRSPSGMTDHDLEDGSACVALLPRLSLSLFLSLSLSLSIFSCYLHSLFTPFSHSSLFSLISLLSLLDQHLPRLFCLSPSSLSLLSLSRATFRS